MITKEAKDPNRFVLPEFYTPSARSGFESFLTWLKNGYGGQILLPAYIGETKKEGSGVMDPVRNAGIEYAFYPLDKQLKPVPDIFYSKIASGEFSAVLLIHYFGFAQGDVRHIQKLCKEHGVLLIEDCAHTLLSQQAGQFLGTFGDAAFHSLHKLTAASEGGIFRVNGDIQFAVPESITSNLSITALHQYLRTDLHATARVRKANFRYYLKHLPQLSGIDWLFPELPEGIVPLNFPILIREGKREPFYFSLIDKGVTVVSLYYQLIQEIDENTFPAAYAISRSILNLPTHQDIEQHDLDSVIQAVIEVHDEIFQ